MIEHVTSISRRRFLGSCAKTGAFVLAAQVVPARLWAVNGVKTGAESAALNPSIYLGINPDGTVFIVTHRSEMGTGIRTTLPLVAADELDADWSKVTIEQGIGDPRYGDQNTDGSRSIRDFYVAFRRAGASARAMLIEAAAAQLSVPASQLTTANHEVIHAKSNRRIGYGALVPAAAKLAVPKPETLVFKPKSAWKFVGKERPIYDLTDILTGKAVFGGDVFRDGMLHASIEHPPVYGGKIKAVDDSETMRVKGVQQIVQLDTVVPPYQFKPLGGVAVIGNDTWSVFQGRKKLKVTWDDGPHAVYDSVTFKQKHIETVHKPGQVVRTLGDVDREFAKGGTVVEATYHTPHGAHASMEPPVAVADVRDGKAEIWAPTQNPQAVQDTVAQVLGIKKEDVTCHVTLLGGGFGRKSKPDFCAEAAVLSRKVGKPVKVVWTREDDLRFDYFHTTAAVYHKAVLDSKGRPAAWLGRSVFPTLTAMFDPKAGAPSAGELGMGFTDLPFEVPNIRLEAGAADVHLRIGWFRAVCNVFHAFALHSFADELAHAARRDPADYLLEMLGPGKILDLKAQGVNYSNYGAPLDRYPVDTGRLRRVLEVAVDKSGWSKRRSRARSGMGIAAHYSFNTYVASVVEVEVDKSGALKIPRVHQVVDCGFVVNPDRVRAQAEGAAAMAVSVAKLGEITATAGRVNQGNFNQFQVARIADAPMRTDVTFVESDRPPTGVGEPTLPPVIAALGNAIFAATGKRIRELPFAKTKLV